METEINNIVKPSLLSGRLLVRNTAFNLLGQGLPLFIALVATPSIVRGLGVDRFGILTIAWMVISYFALFDLGLSRATVKYVAEALGKGEVERLPVLVWTPFGLQLLLGLVAGLILAMFIPLLADVAFNIPHNMASESRSVFVILAYSLPIILMPMVLKGVLEAGQRFALINTVQILAGSLMFLLPLLGIYLGMGLPGIVSLLVVSRLGTAAAYFILCRKLFPSILSSFTFDPQLVRQLMSFGGWMTLSNIVGPILLYLDRLVIGISISVAAVAYYTVPLEVVLRLMVFPVSVILVLFPAFSAIGTASRETIVRLYIRSMKYLFLVMGPLVFIMVLFAREILQLWLGHDFAQQSSLVFQVLAAGMLLTPVQVSVSLLQGIGRPDITAKFYLLEFLFYMPLLWFLVARMGIAGAAVAWTTRVIVDTLLLLFASGKLLEIRVHTVVENGLPRSVLALVLLAAALWMTSRLDGSVLVQAGITFTCLCVFVLASWRYVLDARDKQVLSFSNPK
jgi:O-antigen/teichoic acid export membrane protein